MKRDLTVDFMVDLNQGLWLLGAYSKELVNYLGVERQNEENDYHEKHFLKEMELKKRELVRENRRLNGPQIL